MNHYKIENLKASETFLPSSDEALVELEQEFVCILCHDYVSCLALSLSILYLEKVGQQLPQLLLLH